MGVQEGVGFDEFPEQGDHLGKRVRVCFRYDTSKTLLGTVVREDMEEPGRGIIKLDDGRHVLFTECMYSLELEGSSSDGPALRVVILPDRPL